MQLLRQKAKEKSFGADSGAISVLASDWPAPQKQRSQIFDRSKICGAALLAFCLPSASHAQEVSNLRNNYGSIGLIDLPSARMARDGELAVSASYLQYTQHYNLDFQVLPWLEGSFRYSGLQHFDSSYPVYYDRSFAIKGRLWNETDFRPALAVGINDFVGTGVYGGEYIVASKQFGPIDATFGMGWGRLGTANTTRNPFALLSNRLETRETITTAGETNFGSFFHGRNVGFFGGLVWHTPIDGLSGIFEYSSDKYALETERGGFRPKNQVNLGASYQISSAVLLGLNWMYGRSFGGSISFQFNPKDNQHLQKLGTAPLAIHIRSEEEQRRALQILAREHGSETGPAISATKYLAEKKNTLVDALWRKSDEVSDVQIKGRTLFLSFENEPWQCTNARQVISGNLADIDTIIFQKKKQQQNECLIHNSAARLSAADAGIRLPVLTPSSGSKTDTMIIDARPTGQRKDSVEVIREAILQQNLIPDAISLTESRATIYYSNNRYRTEKDAIERLTRILMLNSPSTVETFRLVSVQNGVPQQEFTISRGAQERDFQQTGDFRVFENGTIAGPVAMSDPIFRTATQSYPRVSWDIFPQFRQQLFDPNNPFAIQFLLGADLIFDLAPGLSINAEAETSIFDNFNQNRPPDSGLPPVRSNFLKYFSQGKTGIGELDLNYSFRFAPEVFAKAKAGYLESMFAGIGGEVLWRPQGQRWALGADLYQVWQRDFNRLFGLQRYNVLTGHISLYYRSPWYDLNFAVRTGRYLAGDKGITFEATRRFDTGVEIGAFFTRTNASAQAFGEGGFDKGIIIRIPIGWMAPVETQGEFTLDLRPLQRDGGQRLSNDASLFNETRRTSEAETIYR